MSPDLLAYYIDWIVVQLFAFTNSIKMIPKFRWIYKMACAVLFIFIVMRNVFKDGSVDMEELESIEKKSIYSWKEIQKIPDEAPLAPVYVQEETRTWDITSSNCSANQNVTVEEEFSALEPNFQQFLLYRHCRYFPMIMNHPEKCSGNVHLLIVIKSIITQHDRREVIRQTWGKEQVIDGKKTKTLFLLGKSSNEIEKENHQKLLEYEDYIYGDILQWDFMDTFFNLTLKETHFLKWFSTYCGSVQYIYKGDDDVFVSVGNILEYLESSTDVKDLFAGDVLMNARPIRRKSNKYYIPETLYNKTYYPPYAGGGGFLMDGALAQKLYRASETLDLYPIDDVFLGMCLEVLRVTPIKHDAFKTFGLLKDKKSKLNKEPCFYKSMIVVHKLLPQELLDMWRLVNSDLVCTQKIKPFIQSAETEAQNL